MIVPPSTPTESITAPFAASTGAKNITVQAGGSGTLDARFCSANSSNESTIYVVGSKSTLSALGSNLTLGNAANKIILRDGGKLILRGAGGWSLTRRIEGDGNVTARELASPYPTNALTVAANGLLAPGESGSVGTLTVTCTNLTFDAGAIMNIDLAGDASNDRVTATTPVSGKVVLGGTLNVGLLGGYQPTATKLSWTILVMLRAT